jgi:hypothetical protein
MKVIIAGSRHMPIEDYPLIHRAVLASGFNLTEVVSGHAKGADQLGEFYAKQKQLPCRIFPADWHTYGKAAGPIRNKQMMEYSDAAIVFIWDNSRGSANMIKQMQENNKPVFIVKNGKL